jgi:DNA polymerase III subunit delta'
LSHPIWDELLGQPEAIEQLQLELTRKKQSLNHAWLFTGPAGSGRSNLAKAFAAALQCEQDGCGKCQQCRLALAGAHPDVSILATDRVLITIDEVRDLVAKSAMGTSMGKYRVIIIEDADRMAERTSNVLLKALEEPPANTIWMLCAPSVADLLPTIRSRVRNLNLRLPSVEEVAELLVTRDGIDPTLALSCAQQAQCHIGMARRLATSHEARSRRSETIRLALSIGNLSQAMSIAEQFLALAKKDAEAIAQERDALETENLKLALGIQEGEKVPAAVRAQFKELEENQKRRGTRTLRDGIDRILTDLESVLRDVMSLQLGTGVSLINESVQADLVQRANQTRIEQSIAALEMIVTSRKRLASNVRDLLVLEALCTKLIWNKNAA